MHVISLSLPAVRTGQKRKQAKFSQGLMCVNTYFWNFSAHFASKQNMGGSYICSLEVHIVSVMEQERQQAKLPSPDVCEHIFLEFLSQNLIIFPQKKNMGGSYICPLEVHIVFVVLEKEGKQS
jgi:hypothetical protein